MEGQENVARVIKSVWLFDGELSPAAFNLRPHIHETYISVLRESCDTFVDDVKTVTHGKLPVIYASMNVADLRNLQVETIEDTVGFDVILVDNQNIRSSDLALQHGVSADSVLLSIRETLADYAKEHIMQISAENG